jgi:hypothetical protein
MKQAFWWFLIAAFTAWALYAAYQLAVGWASAAKREGPRADHANVSWPNVVSIQLLFVVLGLLSTIILTALATNDRWEQQLRKTCQCDMIECHCTIDAELLYRRPNGDANN